MGGMGESSGTRAFLRRAPSAPSLRRRRAVGESRIEWCTPARTRRRRPPPPSRRQTRSGSADGLPHPDECEPAHGRLPLRLVEPGDVCGAVRGAVVSRQPGFRRVTAAACSGIRPGCTRRKCRDDRSRRLGQSERGADAVSTYAASSGGRKQMRAGEPPRRSTAPISVRTRRPCAITAFDRTSTASVPTANTRAAATRTGRGTGLRGRSPRTPERAAAPRLATPGRHSSPGHDWPAAAPTPDFRRSSPRPPSTAAGGPTRPPGDTTPRARVRRQSHRSTDSMPHTRTAPNATKYDQADSADCLKPSATPISAADHASQAQ